MLTEINLSTLILSHSATLSSAAEIPLEVSAPPSALSETAEAGCKYIRAGPSLRGSHF